jgi:hypothetical protein
LGKGKMLMMQFHVAAQHANMLMFRHMTRDKFSSRGREFTSVSLPGWRGGAPCGGCNHVK